MHIMPQFDWINLLNLLNSPQSSSIHTLFNLSNLSMVPRLIASVHPFAQQLKNLSFHKVVSSISGLTHRVKPKLESTRSDSFLWSVMRRQTVLLLPCGKWKTSSELPRTPLFSSGPWISSCRCRCLGEHNSNLYFYYLHCPGTFLCVPNSIFLNCVQKIQNKIGPCLKEFNIKI